MQDKFKICVVGVGYVGLPLANEFSKAGYHVIGFDSSEKRAADLKLGIDSSKSIPMDDLKRSSIIFTADPRCITDCNFIIVAVPTPITDSKLPDLEALKSASKFVGEHMQRGSIVVFESTVYPGVTREICVPIIEKHSGLICGKDWKVGYSPERINPGDGTHTIDKVIKIVSGMDKDSLETIAGVYGTVCKAGVFRAKSIETAEAAKIIENIQRDLNIALMNELSIIFQKMGIDTKDVIEAACTKWNFHKYMPGLVGGHCIGVDPYYLTYRAQEIGYHPRVILAGRMLNDSMAKHVAEMTIKALSKASKSQNPRILVLGITFKENVPDTRNSNVKDMIAELKSFGA